MKNAGSALMGIGYGSGENRAVEAARSAIDSPLLELSIAGAKGLLFNITGGTDLSMFEVDEAAKIITESVDRDANIIFGTTINDDYTGELKITVVATGFDEESNKSFSGQSAMPSKMSPFGRKVDNKPAFQSQSFAVNGPPMSGDQVFQASGPSATCSRFPRHSTGRCETPPLPHSKNPAEVGSSEGRDIGETKRPCQATPSFERASNSGSSRFTPVNNSQETGFGEIGGTPLRTGLNK